jgi:nitrous oxidase accessory protein
VRLPFATILFFLLASPALAETLTVGPPPSQYATIQDALSAAREGDTVVVEGGTYVGQFILDKSIALEGKARPILRGTGTGSVVVVTSDRCLIRGFVIEHSGHDLQREDSGLLLKSSENVIEGNDLRGVLYGIYLFHSERNTIRNNTVRGLSEIEAGGRGAGLHLWNSSENLIEGNTIIETRDGMYIQSSHHNRIHRNHVSRLRYGLHYMNSDDNRFEDNTFEYNVAGAAIMYSKRIEFRRNVFAHNRGFSSFGILFQDCEDNVAEDNLIVDNATGVFMEALRRTSFRGNVIAENDLALMVYSNSEGNVLTKNQFLENLSPLRVVGKRAGAAWSEGGIGNYWSDFDGYDLDSDGIADLPHKVQNVFEYLEGNYPRLRLYLNSPAAQALATAERTFPVVKGSSESDPKPLMRPPAARIVLLEERASRRPMLALISGALVAGAALVMWRGQGR